jgi:hypothetical protein
MMSFAGLPDKDDHGLHGWVRISVESAVPSGECPGKLRWGQRTLQPILSVKSVPSVVDFLSSGIPGRQAAVFSLR